MGGAARLSFSTITITILPRMSKPVFGTCHLCGSHGKLSFEHVPPKAAFNHRRILHTAFEKILAAQNLDDVRGTFQQRGAGAYTLCEKCNNDTGSWYSGAYADWAHQAMCVVISTGGRRLYCIRTICFPSGC